MMISPETFIANFRNKTYTELVTLREELLAEIRAFEANVAHKGEELIGNPSPEVRYQCNLEYLSKLCALIEKTYNREIVWGDKVQAGSYQWVLIIRDWLEENELYDNTIEKKVKERTVGIQYTFAEHLQGLISAQMTSQRPWSGVVPHLAEIDEIFFHYDAEEIKKRPGSYFSNAIFNIKCGNMSTEAQMDCLADNIDTLETIENEYGSLDAFLESEPADRIVKRISDANSKYKLKYIGPALAWEYLKNVGIDGVKPDTHLCRMLGGDHMIASNHSPATREEVYQTVKTISRKTRLPFSVIDSIIWYFCADNYGEICTKKSPKCSKCVVREYCRR